MAWSATRSTAGLKRRGSFTSQRSQEKVTVQEKDSLSADSPLKVFKLVVLTVLVAITIWQGALNIQAFLRHEVVTSVSKEDSDSIEFPRITICNYNRWKLSLLTPEDYAAAYAAYEKANGVNSSSPDTDIDIYNFTYERGWHLVDDYNKNTFTLPRITTLGSCTFSGKRCNTKFFKHRMTSYGNCYTFNNDLKPEDISSSDTSLPLKQSHASEANGFDAYINIEAYDYSEIPETNGSPFLGLKLIVHSKNDYPDPTTSGVTVGPGSYATIALRRTEYSNLPPPEGNCDPQKQLDYFGVYSKTSCEAECKMKSVEQNCSCRPYFYPKGNATCTWNKLIGCSNSIIDAINANFSKFCDCPEACAYEEFSASVTYAPFPNPSYGYSIVRILGLPSISYLQENIVGIKVYFADISSTVITQSAAHTILSTMNDLGGTSGLYVGFSFVTLLELTQVIIELIQSYFVAKKNAVDHFSASVQSIHKEAFN